MKLILEAPFLIASPPTFKCKKEFVPYKRPLVSSLVPLLTENEKLKTNKLISQLN